MRPIEPRPAGFRRSPAHPVVLAFLQNQWFHARSLPAVVAAYSRWGATPAGRAQLNADFLFAGCQTGRRLRAAFGESCDSILWENASPRVGTVASARFAADPGHMLRAVADHRPDVILTFGAVALAGLVTLLPSLDHAVCCINAPHPARRVYPGAELARAAADLRQVIDEISAASTEEGGGN